MLCRNEYCEKSKLGVSIFFVILHFLTVGKRIFLVGTIIFDIIKEVFEVDGKE